MATALEMLIRHFVHYDLRRPIRRRDRKFSGVYLLIDRGEIVYVGRTSDLDVRIEQHQDGGKFFQVVLWRQIPVAEQPNYESALIRALRPRLNKFIPCRSDQHAEIVAEFGLSGARIWRHPLGSAGESAQRTAYEHGGDSGAEHCTALEVQVFSEPQRTSALPHCATYHDIVSHVERSA